MIKSGIKSTLYLLIFLLMLSCRNSPEKPLIHSNNPVAVIGKDSIYLSEVDQQIQQQLYDQLYQVYLFRKRTLESIIDQKLLENLASSRGIPVDSMLLSYVKDEDIAHAIAEYDATKKGVVDIKRGLRFVPANTDEGKELTRYKFIEIARNKILDSLRRTTPVNITLIPPKSPFFSSDDLQVTWLPQSNLKSKKEIILISDFECNHCRESHKVISKLINKYKDKYKFGIVPYGSYTTLYLTSCEVIKHYNKFWEMYDYLMKEPLLLDTAGIIKYVSTQNIDTLNFKKELQSEHIKQTLLNGFQKVKEKGILATPSILINGKLIYNAFSEEELEKVINS